MPRPFLKLSLLFVAALIFSLPQVAARAGSPSGAAADDAHGPIDEMVRTLSQKLPEGDLKVAVAPLRPEPASSTSPAGGQPTQFGRYAAEKLTNGLIRYAGGRYRVMERSLVDRLMGERIDLTAEKAQEILKADILVTGVYATIGSQVEILARAIDLSSAQALAAAEAVIPLAGVAAMLPADASPMRTSADDEALSIDVALLAYKTIDGREREVAIRSGDTLYSGDQFKIDFRANRDCYLYVINYDSLGQVNVIFPHPQIALENRIVRDRTYSLPGGDLTYYADDNTGLEQLYVVAQLKPMKDIDALLASIQKAAGNAKQALGDELKSAISTRGFGVREKTAPSTLGARDTLMAVVNGQAKAMKVWQIVHR